MGTFVAEAGADVSVGGKSVVRSAGGEADYVYKSNGNPDSQVHENGDGDLPSFSIKRLRRLPLRVACEQQPPSPSPPPTVDRSWPEEEDANVVGSVKQRQPDAVDELPQLRQEREQEHKQVEEQKQVQEQGQGLSDLSIRENDAMECRPDAIAEVENGKHASEETEEAGAALAPDLSRDLSVPEEEEKQTGIGSGQEKQSENGLVGEEGKQQTGNGEISEENKDPVAAAAPEHAETSIGESANTSTHPEVEHPAPEQHTSVDTQLRENASSPGISESVSEDVKYVSPDPNPDLLADDKGKASEEAAAEDELVSPGLVQILPPVMGSRFESSGETTDEETDSPRSSEGFAYPGDSDAMALPYSGQILYPSRLSQSAANGPHLLQYSGSMSLRSDSSTTSNRSFAFPILAPPEWNSSPVRMAKAHPRRKNRFDGCCFFRLSRILNKY